MLTFLKKVNRKLKRIFTIAKTPGYDFNKSNPLGDNGERVDIQLDDVALDFDKLDVYQKNHWKRYEFAKGIINTGDVCGDFACGTGYGSILLASKAKSVIGADLNSKVITTITKRYKDHNNVSFLNENLLHLDFNDQFDTIISFETLEHFQEEDIKTLLVLFNKALKNSGRLIFSTPYMQAESETAKKMGFHLTFYINEQKIKNWLKEAGFETEIIKYQNYETHFIEDNPATKEFIICIAVKLPGNSL